MGGGRTLGGTSRARSGMCRSPMTSIRKVIAAAGVRGLRGGEPVTSAAQEGLDARDQFWSAATIRIGWSEALVIACYARDGELGARSWCGLCGACCCGLFGGELW